MMNSELRLAYYTGVIQKGFVNRDRLGGVYKKFFQVIDPVI